MKHGLKVLLAAACLLLPMFATASVIKLQISGGVLCPEVLVRPEGACGTGGPYIGLPGEMYAQQMAAFERDTGFADFYGDFTMDLRISSTGDPYIASGRVTVGTLSFMATATLTSDPQRNPSEPYFPSTACRGTQPNQTIYAIWLEALPDANISDGGSPLCIVTPETFQSFTWQQVASLAETAMLEADNGCTVCAFENGLIANRREWFALWVATDLDFVGRVPEPTTLALLGVGLAGIAAARKRKAA